MIKIVITSEHRVDDEAARIKELLNGRFDLLHLRKPSWSIDECRRLLGEIDRSLYDRIVIHDFYTLYKEFNLRGVHITGRNPEIPCDISPKHISCSCHSLEEVKAKKPFMDYVFLSPIFDSISKAGYESHFNYETLRDAASRGIIDRKVIALGGVTEDKTDILSEIGFGGFAMLGNVWL